MENDNNEVHVVKEIPVYFSKCMGRKLYLLQQPLRPAIYDIDKTNIVKAKYKPECEKIQLTVGINTDSKKYDQDKGEHLANQQDDNPDHLLFDEHVLESTMEPNANSSRYIVGALFNDRVHLFPLKSVVQLKTVYPHLKTKEKSKTGKGEDTATETEDEIDEPEKITVKFSRIPKEPTAKDGKDKPQGRNFYSQKKKNDDETWVDLENINNSEEELKEITSIPKDQVGKIYVTKHADYLNLIFPKHKEPTIPK